jgi:hypothetical protein
MKEPNHRHCRPLRARRERPRDRTAEHGDEIASFDLTGLHPLPLPRQAA